MSMGERLRKARLKMGYSQEEVARRIDTHRTTIGKWYYVKKKYQSN